MAKAPEYQVRSDTGLTIGPFDTKLEARRSASTFARNWAAGAGHSVRYGFLSRKYRMYKNGQHVLTIWIERIK